MEKKHIFLIGAKSLGAYGGYETFVNKLTEYHQYNEKLKYYVACKENGDGSMNPYDIDDVNIISDKEFEYNNAYCFRIHIPEKLGAAQAIYYDIQALKKTCQIIEKQHLKDPIVYIMACRIGPFIKKYYKKIHSLGGKIYLNPDGHEWMRAKWNFVIRKYWKYSEKTMVKYSDLVICDSINIEKYIHKAYDSKGLKGKNPSTTYIAYGAETRKSKISNDDEKLQQWYKKYDVNVNQYYLVVGRFVPENNYETMIREFMKSTTKKDFVIITNVNKKFLEELQERLNYRIDKRIKFVGTVYNQELLKKIRENAYGYFHGHEVGGTNPSLLEALGSTKINLLLNVGFNKEVAKDAAFYWSKKSGSLACLIEKADKLNDEEIEMMGLKAKDRIQKAYSWKYIADRYEEVFSK